MIFDKQNLFSDAQAITATAASTNTIDLGKTGTVMGESAPVARDMGAGMNVPLRVQVVEDFTNLTSLTIAIQTDDNEAFSSAKTVLSQTLTLAELKAGAVAGALRFVPRGVAERYVRLHYTVTGSAPNRGRITAGIVMGHQENPA